MKKFLELLILRTVLYVYIMTFSVELAPATYMYAGKHFIFVDSYVASIDMPNYGNDNALLVLEEFSAMGKGKAVIFEPPSQPTSFSPVRAIHIKESKVIDGDEDIVGLALPLWNTCDIQIESGQDYETFRQVLIHEYLHCMGYSHVNNSKDVMNPSVAFPSEENIQRYAKDIEARRNGRF